MTEYTQTLEWMRLSNELRWNQCLLSELKQEKEEEMSYKVSGSGIASKPNGSRLLFKLFLKIKAFDVECGSRGLPYKL